MKLCPWCGRNNLDSDEYCFNCERDLSATPDEEQAFVLEQEMRRTRVYRPPSMIKLVAISMLCKVMFAVLAMGAFFIFALVAIWVSYDSDIVALVALGVLGAATFCALYYPDIKVSRRIGNRGILVSILANFLVLGIFLPPVLWYLATKGYIEGVWDFMGKYWWAVVAFLSLGMLIAWLAGRRTRTETANP